MKTLVQLMRDEQGASMIEYGLISGIVALATLASVVILEAKFITIVHV